MHLDIATMAARRIGPGSGSSWPEFMTQDPSGSFYYGDLEEHLPEHCLLAVASRSTSRGAPTIWGAG